MKKLSLQWRLTITIALVITITCIILNIFLSRTGIFYINSLEKNILNPDSQSQELYIEFSEKDWADFSSQFSLRFTNTKRSYNLNSWIITLIVTILSAVITYFISGYALKPLKEFSNQIEQIEVSNITKCSISTSNVPEFQQLIHSFNKMLARISESFLSLRQFNGNAAHEFRTPLALIQSQLELYDEINHKPLDSETQETFSMIKEQTERLSILIKLLLDMSELQTIPRTDTIELPALIDEVLADLSPLAEKNNITLVQSNSDNIIITGSDILIYRLLFNLTENAIRYNRSCGNVNISAKKQLNSIIIDVSDNGFGIPSELQQNIFQPFYRIDKSRSRAFGGVGLGLTLAQKIIELHDGQICVSESSANGTTFEIKLPLNPLSIK